jgi:F0F1-type ATP synthase assembly protein I
MSVVGNRIHTIGRVIRHFLSAKRWFMIPLLLVLLLAGVLLLVTGGLSYVAPFVYTIF